MFNHDPYGYWKNRRQMEKLFHPSYRKLDKLAGVGPIRRFLNWLFSINPNGPFPAIVWSGYKRIAKEEKSIAVQVDGITIDFVYATFEAIGSPKLEDYLAGRKITDTIIVPNKLVNFITY